MMQKVKLDTPTLVLGAGFCCSGKTVVLNEVAKRVDDSFIIDKDIINESFLSIRNSASTDLDAYVLAGPKKTITDDYYHQYVKFQTYNCLIGLAKNNLELGKHPFLEGSYIKEIRNGYLDRIFFPSFESIQHKTKIVFCHADEETLKKRIKERAASRDLYKLKSDFDWKKFLEEQPILPLELENYEHIKVDTTKPLENNVPMVLDYLKS